MKEFDLIIKNGTVVTSTESFLCDVAVKDGKIVKQPSVWLCTRCWLKTGLIGGAE